MPLVCKLENPPLNLQRGEIQSTVYNLFKAYIGICSTGIKPTSGSACQEIRENAYSRFAFHNKPTIW